MVEWVVAEMGGAVNTATGFIVIGSWNRPFTRLPTRKVNLHSCLRTFAGKTFKCSSSDSSFSTSARVTPWSATTAYDKPKY